MIHLVLLAQLPQDCDFEWALFLCTTSVVDYHQEDLFDTLANNSVDVVLRRCGLCLEKPLCWPREALGQAWLLSFGRDTRPHGVDHGITRGSDHSRWDWASQSGEPPPLRGHHGHLSSTCYAGDVAETSSNKQCAFRQLWKKYGGVYIGRESHVHCVFPRGPRGSERSRQSCAPHCGHLTLPRGRVCSLSAEKHVHIVFVIRGLREPEHSRQC